MNVDDTVKSRRSVMPANAGIQKLLKTLDPGFRQDDGKTLFRIFYEFINVCSPVLSALIHLKFLFCRSVG